jgi:carbon-monoxide dehydrogenase large subunit
VEGVAKIGEPVRRREDARLLRGEGRFTDDFSIPGQAFMALVRSPHAHARIVSIDTRDALKRPGVLAALTGKDAQELNPIPHMPSSISPPDIALENSDGRPKYFARHVPLPPERARFVGEAVALVIAETAALAKDAAEAVQVDYEPLPAVSDALRAVEAGAPLVWPDAPLNTYVDANVGDAAATDEAFRRAKHVTRLSTWLPRATAVPLEPRSVLAQYDAATGRYTLYAGSGGSLRQRHDLAKTLGIDEKLARVIAQDVGGNFGTRNAFYVEFALAAWCAKRLGRPVKWTAERHEAFLSDYQGRDLHVEAELALDAEGRFLALRGTNTSNVGAYTVSFVPLTKGVETMTGAYRIPVASFRARAVATNTPPTYPYRSAGRPEAMYVMERLIELAAREHGFDAVELRRENLIAGGNQPHANPLGITYDGGEYARLMEKALELADHAGFAKRKEQSARRGRLRGFGTANYIEVTSGAPRERADLTFKPDGRLELVIGTLSSGQGHETSFTQVASAWLGIPAGRIDFVAGDTDRLVAGGGSHSGRSMRMGGIVIGKATQELIEKGRRIAARVLEAAEDDIEFAAGRFSIRGTDRGMDFFQVARASPEPLSASGDETVRVGGFPYGCHACEVEIDPETGSTELVGYVAVDDVGRAINPMILHGQAHGGVTQGLGQAMFEQCHYDAGTAQLLSGSLMDYALPRADMLPAFTTSISEVPSASNPLGVRAGGEGGTTGAPAAYANAVHDALRAAGVRQLDLPMTADRVWRAMNSTEKRVEQP